MTDLFHDTPAQRVDPRNKTCATCGSDRAHCGMAGQWYCVGCVSPSYWPVSPPAEIGPDQGKVGV